MIHSGRFMNLPAAVVAIVIRKLFDSYAGGEIAELVPAGLGVAEYLRDYIRSHIQSGVSIYIIGAAVTTVTYYLKNCKVVRVIKHGFWSDRSRDNIACMTTKSIFKRSGLNRSLRLLFRREDRQRGTFPKSRPSTATLIQTRSSTNRRQQTRGTPDLNSAPLQAMFKEPRLQVDSCAESMVSVTSNDSRPSTVSTGTSTTVAEDFSFAHPQPRKKPATKHCMTMTQDVVTPNGAMPQLQDVYGNIYEHRQTGVSHQSDETDDRMSQSPADAFRAFETDNCDGDYTRPSTVDAFGPNEQLPTETGVVFYKDRAPSKSAPKSPTRRAPPRAKQKTPSPKTKKRVGVPRSRNRGRRTTRSRVMSEGLRSAASLARTQES